MTDPKPHLLIVDDERSMRELLEYMLAREGYTIALAENGRRALDLIQANDYDLVLTDISWGISPAWMSCGPPRRKIRPRGDHDLGLCHHRNRRGGHERGRLRLCAQALRQ